MVANNLNNKKPTLYKAVIIDGHDLHKQQPAKYTKKEQARLQRIAVWQKEDTKRQKQKNRRLQKEARLSQLEKFEEIEKDLPKTVFDSDDLDIK